MTEPTTHTLNVPGAVLAYDVREPSDPGDHRPLFIFGSPIIAAVLLLEALGLDREKLPLILLPGLLAAGIGSLISIAVRGVMTVGELIYVGAVTALGRREGWSIHTGILHPSPEEEEAPVEAAGHVQNLRRRRQVAQARRVGGVAPAHELKAGLAAAVTLPPDVDRVPFAQ